MVSTLAPEEFDKADRYLAETRDALSQTVGSLSISQMDFRPAADRWSIAEIVEHVVFVEGRVHTILSGLSNHDAAGPDQRRHDDFIVQQVPQRTERVEAPPRARPTGRVNGEEGLKLFLQAREQTMRLISTPGLRDHVFPHPMFGPWDGYQWLLAAGSHAARHTDQIREVKAALAFPKLKL